MNSKNTIAKNIGNRINAALALRNMRQKDLAKHLGVTDNTISYFCSGARTPKAEQIAEIAHFLNVSSDYLLGIDDYPSADKATKELCATLGLSDLSIKYLQ